MSTGTSQTDEGEFEVRHRNPLARDFVIVSRVILLGYPQLSDGAKLTYWVIYDHDWVSPQSGGRKGYAYPTLRRLAQLRHTTDRTIRRHLADLIAAQLLSRELRPGKPSLLYIEEPTGPELDRYLNERQGGTDKNVRPPRTKMSAPYKADKEKQDKTVNGVREIMEERASRSGDWTSIGQLLNPDRMATASKAHSRIDWLADEMISSTADSDSRGCYVTIAKYCPEPVIFEALSLLKETRTDGTVLRSRGGFFVSTIRRLCQQQGLADPLAKRQDGSAKDEAGDQSGYNPTKRRNSSALSYKAPGAGAADSEAVEARRTHTVGRSEKSPDWRAPMTASRTLAVRVQERPQQDVIE
jgi:hypothetical protein